MPTTYALPGQPNFEHFALPDHDGGFDFIAIGYDHVFVSVSEDPADGYLPASPAVAASILARLA